MSDGHHINPDGYVTDEFSSLMLDVAAGYPTAKINERGIRLYARAFGHVPIESMRKLFDRAVRDHKMFPSIAELNAYLQASADDSALLAWTSLQQAAERVGQYASLQIDDGNAATALLDVFGSWPAFCQMEEGPALALKRQEFLAAYRNARRRRRASTRLIGLCEAEGRGQPPDGTTWTYRLSASGDLQAKKQKALAAPVAGELRR